MVVAFMAAVQLGYVSQHLRGISGGKTYPDEPAEDGTGKCGC